MPRRSDRATSARPAHHLHPAGPLRLLQPAVPDRDADHGGDEVEVAAACGRAGRGVAGLLQPLPAGAPQGRCRGAVADAASRADPRRRRSASASCRIEFSGGQRQRLMIALALLPQPRARHRRRADHRARRDNPGANPQAAEAARQESGVSVLFTTHDLGTAYEICDRITVMYAGQEVETAPVDDFFRRPRHPYTVRLLESLPGPGARTARDRRRNPGADQPAHRMPLPSPLRACERNLPH